MEGLQIAVLVAVIVLALMVSFGYYFDAKKSKQHIEEMKVERTDLQLRLNATLDDIRELKVRSGLEETKAKLYEAEAEVSKLTSRLAELEKMLSEERERANSAMASASLARAEQAAALASAARGDQDFRKQNDELESRFADALRRIDELSSAVEKAERSGGAVADFTKLPSMLASADEELSKLFNGSDQANAPLLPRSGSGPVSPVSWKNVVLVSPETEESSDIKAWLGEEGYSVLVTSSEPEAMRLAQDTETAALVVDLRLPEEIGWELLSRLLDDAHTKDVPVLVLGDAKDRERVKNIALAGYIGHPVERNLLVGTLRASLIKRRSRVRRMEVARGISFAAARNQA